MSDPVCQARAALRRPDGEATLDQYDDRANDMPDDRLLAGRVRALRLFRRWANARETFALPFQRHSDSVRTILSHGMIGLGQTNEPTPINVPHWPVHRDAATIARNPTSDLSAVGLATALRVAIEALRCGQDAVPGHHLRCRDYPRGGGVLTNLKRTAEIQPVNVFPAS
jgi:hypothetical protein